MQETYFINKKKLFSSSHQNAEMSVVKTSVACVIIKLCCTCYIHALHYSTLQLTLGDEEEEFSTSHVIRDDNNPTQKPMEVLQFCH